MSRLPSYIAPGINTQPPPAPPARPAARPATTTKTTTSLDDANRMPSFFPAAAPGAPPAARPAHAPPTTPVDARVNAVDALMPGDLGGGVRLLSESDVTDASIMEDDLRLPIGVLLLGLLGAIGIQGAIAWSGAGAVGAALAAVGILVAVSFGVLLNTPCAWLVSKMFNADYGSIGSLALRIGAVCSAQALLGALLPPFVAIIAGLPIFLVLAIWLIGIDFFQAFVLSVVATIANIVLATFVLGSIGVMMAA